MRRIVANATDRITVTRGRVALARALTHVRRGMPLLALKPSLARVPSCSPVAARQRAYARREDLA
jgi:hypothetical protein